LIISDHNSLQMLFDKISSVYFIWKVSAQFHSLLGVPAQTNWAAVPVTHIFNGPFSGTTRVSRYRKVIPIWILLKQRDNEWQWPQLGYMQVYTSLQTDNHASTPPLSFLQARCPSCRPTNSVKALKATAVPVKQKKCVCMCDVSLQCFDAVGWAAGRASGL